MSVTVSGGNKIAERIAEIKRKFSDAPTVLVGVPKSAGNAKERYVKKDGEVVERDSDVHTAVVMAALEFGTKTQPERAPLRNGINDAIPSIKKLYNLKMPEVISGGIDIETIQRLVGELCVGSIVEFMSSSPPPPNAPSTVKTKGSSTTTINSGHTRQSITYVLSEPGEEISEGL